MASIDYSQVTDELPQKASGPVQPDMADMVGIARRGWFFIVAGTIFGLLGAFAVLSNLPPIYKASSRIAFERTLSRYMQSNKVTNEPMIEDADTLGQIYVISSESIVLPVVHALSLTNDPEFVGGLGTGGLGSRIRGLVQTTAHAMGLQEEAREEVPSQQTLEKVALDGVLRNLSVTREDVASVINVAFSSKDPVKASTIANAVVDAYLEAGIAGKLKSTKIAGKVVQERVDELKRQAADAERALLEYKVANNLAGSSKGGLAGEQLATLQSHLTSERVAMAEAKAKMERIASAGTENTFVPDNDLIGRLRSQLFDLSERANDFESRVGKDHVATIKVRNRMEELREAIANEQQRISGSFGKDYELARARYDEISATMTRLMGEEGASSDTQARIRELESSADTLRSLYNRMLQQLSEMNKVEAQPSIAPDALVLMRAAPPTQTEASKKRWLILAGGSFIGFLLGGCVVLVRNFPFGVFRTSQQVTDATGLFCAVLPAIVNAEEQASVQTGEYALNAPYSRFSETLRNIWALINIAQQKSGAKVICVISSVPGEGKTTVATNLAAHFARHSATRVLVIDADFHRPSLTERIAPDAQVGLKEALVEPTALSKYVIRKERFNLDVLPCPITDRIPNAAELLGTEEMEQLVDTARDAYDLVIIEAPPMAAVVDYKMIARHCDRFVFVVEWGKTSQRMVLECLDDASALLDRVVCIVLNKMEPSALRSIEHYKGDSFHDYYSDGKQGSRPSALPSSFASRCWRSISGTSRRSSP
jgi:succinoglycan biosynthesis transport protein ExoP